MAASSSPTRFSRLTLIQADPLVWVDHDDRRHALPRPNFKEEQRDIEESVQEARAIDAEIEVVVEPANVERISAFLAMGSSPIMHFSGHGHSSYLAIENEGVMKTLLVDELRELFAAGRGNLMVVVVSACHSRPAGEAFLEAGVKHVVCCEQNEELTDAAAIVFARNFYRALAVGNTLKKAFELARQAVRVSPEVVDAQHEMAKFVLLPEECDDGYHDVDVFYASSENLRTSRHRVTNFKSGRICDIREPRLFIGRQLQLFKLVESIGSRPLVSLTGPNGIGRASIARAACNYMFERSRAFHAFYWVSAEPIRSGDSLLEALHRIHVALMNGARFDTDMITFEIVTRLRETRALLVFDARSFTRHSMTELESFLDHLFLDTECTKAIILCPPDQVARVAHHHWEPLKLPPLDFKSTVLLFGLACPLVSGKRCPKVRTNNDLVRLLVPPDKEDVPADSQCLTRRCSRILSYIGRGIPGDILAAATMSVEDYDNLIRIGRRSEFRPRFNTRVELDNEIERFSFLMAQAEKRQDFLAADEYQEKLQELCWLQGDLLSLSELKRKKEKLQFDMAAAASSLAYQEAAIYKTQLQEVQARIKAEMMDYKSVVHPSSSPVEFGKEVTAGLLSRTAVAKTPKSAVSPPVHDQTKDQNLSDVISMSPDLTHSLLSGNSRDIPPAMQMTDGSSTYSSDGLDGYVGVELSGAVMDDDADWNSHVIKSKNHLEKSLGKLLKYGTLVDGEVSLQVEEIERDGVSRAVARLDCEFQLRDDLRKEEYSRVKEICRKIAGLLRDAGTSESVLERLMIGCAWKGSLEILLEAPTTVLAQLFAMLVNAKMKLEIELGKVHLVALAPAMLVRGPLRLRAPLENSVRCPDALLWKEEGCRLLCPTSLDARTQVLAGGLKYHLWDDIRCESTSVHLPYVTSIQGGVWENYPHTEGTARTESKDLSQHLGVSPLKMSENLSYENVSLSARKDVREKREREGFCLECKGEPVKLYDMHRSRLSPWRKRREPLTVSGSCYKGQCLRCHPDLDPDHARSLHTSEVVEEGTGVGVQSKEETVEVHVDSELWSPHEMTAQRASPITVPHLSSTGPIDSPQTPSTTGERKKVAYRDPKFSSPSPSRAKKLTNVRPNDIVGKGHRGHFSPETPRRESHHAETTPEQQTQTQVGRESSSAGTNSEEGSNQAVLNELDTLLKELAGAGNTEIVADVILRTVKDNSAEEPILCYCLSKIWDFCKDNEDDRERFMSKGAPDDILLAMKNHPASRRLQEKGCGALWSIMSTKTENVVKVVRAGAPACIVRALSEHKADKHLVEVALGALRCMSPNTEGRHSLDGLHAKKHVCQAMTQHREVAIIQRDGCAILNNTSVDTQNMVVSVATKEELDVVVDAMDAHKNDRNVMKSAVCALKNYTCEETNLRTMRQCTGVFACLDIAIRMDEDFRSDAEVVLTRLVESRDEDERLGRLSGENEMLEESICATLAAKLDSTPWTRVQSAVNAMVEHNWSPKICATGMDCLQESLMEAPGVKELFTTSTIQMIIGTMGSFESNKQVQLSGCGLLKRLSDLNDERIFASLLRVGVSGRLLLLLENYRGDQDVMIEAFAVLLGLTRDIECSVELVDKQASYAIQEVLELHPDSEVLNRYGMEILSMFVAYQSAT